jgi:hypothetical protein
MAENVVKAVINKCVTVTRKKVVSYCNALLLNKSNYNYSYSYHKIVISYSNALLVTQYRTTLSNTDRDTTVKMHSNYRYIIPITKCIQDTCAMFLNTRYFTK